MGRLKLRKADKLISSSIRMTPGTRVELMRLARVLNSSQSELIRHGLYLVAKELTSGT
jgi:hypothetical protein